MARDRFDLQSDFSRLPDILVPDHDPLRMLASCYLLCKEHPTDLYNAIEPVSAGRTRYLVLREWFLGLLSINHQPPAAYLPGKIPALKAMLQPADYNEALVHCAALLRALDAYVADQYWTLPISALTSEGLDKIEILISRKPKNVIERLMSRLPRQSQEISDMPSIYHPFLHLTPVKIKDHHLV